MWDLLEQWFGGGFMRHGRCYLWTPAMGWTQVTANTRIGLAYLSISATLAHLVRREGVTRVMQKPLRLERLLSVVHEYCARPDWLKRSREGGP